MSLLRTFVLEMIFIKLEGFFFGFQFFGESLHIQLDILFIGKVISFVFTLYFKSKSIIRCLTF